MSEHLAPDPKPSCCLSSPQGTCEAHVTWSTDELRIMELEARVASALDRLTRRPVHYLSWRALARVAEDTIAILGGRKVEQAACDACDHPWSKHDAEDGCQADCYCPRAPPPEKTP